MHHTRLSNKFRWLSLVATWAVVCIHSRTDRWAEGVSDFSALIEEHVADLFNFAVPLFFIISGCLFVHSYERYGWYGLLCRKLRSLYVPMVIWSVIGLVLCLPIRVYSHHAIPTVIDVLKLPIMLFRPESIHFWFVRALIIITLISPIVIYVAKHMWLIVTLILAMLAIPSGSLPSQLHIPTTIIFFLIGTQLERIKLENYSRGGVLVCSIGLVLSFLCKEHMSHAFPILVEPLLMIGLLWFGYDVVDKKFHVRQFPDELNVLFFVYCMHLITLCWCGGMIRILFGNGPWTRLFGYFALWLTFWVNLIVANVIRKYFPRMFAVLSGNR